MRKQLLLALAILLAICGCTNIEDRKKLSEVRELLEHSPDSALLLLETSFIPPLMSDKNLAEWCMLNGEVCDSLNEQITTDIDILKRTINFFQRNNRSKEEALAHQYLGRSYMYENYYDYAVEEYLLSIDIAEKERDYNIAGYSNSYLADIYRKRYNDEKSAIKYYKRSAELFLKMGNIRSYGRALRDIFTMEMIHENYEEAFNVYTKADSVAHLTNDSLLLGALANNIGIYYDEMGEYDLAEYHILKASEYHQIDASINLWSLFLVYMKQGKTEFADSLMNIYNKDYNQYYEMKCSYWRHMYLMYKKAGNMSKALESYEKTMAYTDTVLQKLDSIRVDKITKKYDYSKVIEENIILANRLHTRLMWIFILITISLLIYLIYNRKVNRKVHELEAKQRQLEEEEHNRKEQELKLKQQELEYQEKLLAYRQQKYELEKLIKEEAKTKQNLLRNSLIFKKINMLSELSTKNQDAFKAEVGKVMNSPSLSEHDWEEIKKEVNYVYPDFTSNLSEKITKLTEEEIRFCCLLKVGLETTELAILLDINPYSVNRRRSRINKKIRDVYPDLSWNEFLSQL